MFGVGNGGTPDMSSALISTLQEVKVGFHVGATNIPLGPSWLASLHCLHLITPLGARETHFNHLHHVIYLLDEIKELLVHRISLLYLLIVVEHIGLVLLLLLLAIIIAYTWLRVCGIVECLLKIVIRPDHHCEGLLCLFSA